jgi:hypothetical protein
MIQKLQITGLVINDVVVENQTGQSYVIHILASDQHFRLQTRMRATLVLRSMGSIIPPKIATPSSLVSPVHP